MINEIFPAEKVKFRTFNVEKFKDFTNNYLSFYEVPLKDEKFLSLKSSQI